MVNLAMAWKRIRTAAELPDVRFMIRRTVGSAGAGWGLASFGRVRAHQKKTKDTAGFAYFDQGAAQGLDKHGRNVVGFAARESVGRKDRRLPTTDSSGSRWQVHSSPEKPCTSWSGRNPPNLATHFGISDVGLAKACKRANIPTPDRGYWARAAAGKDCVKTPLPHLESSAPVKFREEARQRRRIN